MATSKQLYIFELFWKPIESNVLEVKRIFITKTPDRWKEFYENKKEKGREGSYKFRTTAVKELNLH